MVNSAAVLSETSFVDTLDDITATLLQLRRVIRPSPRAPSLISGEGPDGAEAVVHLGLDDFVSAFKTIFPTQDQRWLSGTHRSNGAVPRRCFFTSDHTDSTMQGGGWDMDQLEHSAGRWL